MLILATFIDYLDDHQGAVTALLTFALVAVTVYYAVQNRRMANEMARARGQAILPKLALDFHRLGPTAMTVAIRNVGPGAAFEIAVRLSFIPVADGTAPEERELRLAVLSSDDQRDYPPPWRAQRQSQHADRRLPRHSGKSGNDSCVRARAHRRSALRGRRSRAPTGGSARQAVRSAPRANPNGAQLDRAGRGASRSCPIP